MDKQQGDGTPHRASLVYVMRLQLSKSLHLYGARKHGECVKLALMSAPVITVPPSFGQPPCVRERSTVGPVRVINFVWETGVVELSFEKGKLLLRDGNLEGLLVGHDIWS